MAAALGCGAGVPPAPQAPASQSTLAAPPVARPVDLSPVPMPPSLFLSGHLARPSVSLATVNSWSHVPIPQSEQVTEALLGAPLGPLVDLGAPLDVAVAFGGGPAKKSLMSADSTPRIVVSAAVKNADLTKAALAEHYKMTPMSGGGLLLGELAPRVAEGTEDDDGASARRTCALLPAYGPSAMRLLCTRGDERALFELGPWLTRSATRATATTDLHIDLRMDPLKAAVSGRMKMLVGILGGLVSGSVDLPSSRDLVTSVLTDVGDFILDLDSANLDIELSDPAATAGETLKFSGTSSTIARLATANADRNGAPPPLLWQLPGDASFALFERGIAPRELARAWDLVLGVVSEASTAARLQPADREAIVEAFRALPSSAPAVCAGGADAATLQQVLAGWASTSDERALTDALRRASEAAFGWTVLELEEPASRLTSALGKLSAAWSRPSVLAAIRALGGAPPPALRAAPLGKREGVTATGAAAAPWPKDAVHYILDLPLPPPENTNSGRPKSPAPVAKISIHAYVLPDGARTWVAFGANERLVTSKLALAMAGSGETLDGRADLAALREQRVGSGGFVTFRGLLISLLPTIALVGERPVATWLFNELEHLPHQGVSPMTFSMTPETAANASSVKATLQVPRGAIEDILGAALTLGGF